MRAVMLWATAVAFAGGTVLAQPKPSVDQSRNWDAFVKLYPKRALAAGEQGLVAFKLTLDRAGHPTECVVTHSSGHASLDNETCDLLLLHAVFQPPKDSDGNRMSAFHTEGVINWRIPGKEAATTALKIASADPLEKKVCKRTVRTGTLAGFERVCMTVREWDRQRAASMDSVADMQGKKGFTSGKD